MSSMIQLKTTTIIVKRAVRPYAKTFERHTARPDDVFLNAFALTAV